jgi:hypothetical protein
VKKKQIAGKKALCFSAARPEQADAGSAIVKKNCSPFKNDVLHEKQTRDNIVSC